MKTIPTLLFADGFESGDFSKWSSHGAYADHLPAVNGVNPHSGSYSYEQEYYLPVGGPYPQDQNRFIIENFADCGRPAGLADFILKAYHYPKHPEADADATKSTQRKLTRCMHDTAQAPSATNFEVELIGWQLANQYGLDLAIGYYNPAFQMPYISVQLAYNAWYLLEQEIHLNTPGVGDGVYKLSVNGTLRYTLSGVQLRNTQTTNLGGVCIGDQVNKTTDYTVHEFRYWDDVQIWALDPHGSGRQNWRRFPTPGRKAQAW